MYYSFVTILFDLFFCASTYNNSMEKRIKRILSIAAVAAAGIVATAAFAVCAVFPNKYAHELNAAADEFGLDRVFVQAVVWTESKFDARAVSGKGAMGLMQLMPDTLTECATAIGECADGFDPKVNLRCGCYYLSLMLDKFGGNKSAALMAYNAGENNARRFLNGERVFPETEEYLKSVKRAEKVYDVFG